MDMTEFQRFLNKAKIWIKNRKKFRRNNILVGAVFVFVLVAATIMAIIIHFSREHNTAAVFNKRQTNNHGVLSCPTIKVKQTYSISNYFEENRNIVKFCPVAKGSYVSFNCETNGDNLSWYFNGIMKNFTYTDFLNSNWHNHTSVPGHADVYFVLYYAKNLSNTTHYNYELRSSVTAFPSMSNFSLNFTVRCSSFCQRQKKVERKSYIQAERPERPQNIHKKLEVPNCTCCNKTSHRFTWEHPNNYKNMFLYYYEYIHNSDKSVTTLVNQSYTYNNATTRSYNFRVRAIDRCRQSGHYAEFHPGDT